MVGDRQQISGVRGEQDFQVGLLTLTSLGKRVPVTHPIREIKRMADAALGQMDPVFEAMYSTTGRPSIPPERLLKAQLLIALYSVRSERQFCERLDYDLLFRFFLDMNLDDPSSSCPEARSRERSGIPEKTATTEKSLPLPPQFLAAWIGMWLGEHQARVIQYQRAENEALRERLGKCRLQLTDRERRRLAKLGKLLGRKALQEVATIATPDTILRWYREMVAAKYDGSKKRVPGRPKKASEIVRLLLEMASQSTTLGLHEVARRSEELGLRHRADHRPAYSL